jgi:hypothetical protein
LDLIPEVKKASDLDTCSAYPLKILPGDVADKPGDDFLHRVQNFALQAYGLMVKPESFIFHHKTAFIRLKKTDATKTIFEQLTSLK